MAETENSRAPENRGGVPGEVSEKSLGCYAALAWRTVVLLGIVYLGNSEIRSLSAANLLCAH